MGSALGLNLGPATFLLRVLGSYKAWFPHPLTGTGVYFTVVMLQALWLTRYHMQNAEYYACPVGAQPTVAVIIVI